MDKNPDLQKQAKPGEIAIKGTMQPDITTEPVAPAKVSSEYVPFSGDHAMRLNPDGTMKDPVAKDDE